METMKIQQIFFKNNLRNFCYLIYFDDGSIYCIDPFRSTEVFDHLGDKSLTAIINTHDHCDHYSGNEDLTKTFNCSVMAHFEAQIPHKTKSLNDLEVIHECRHGTDFWSLKSLYTPGHTLSHLCLLLEKNHKAWALFTGDCFFNAGVGNCHNGGDPEILFQTIETVFKYLPDELLIYPGHEYLKRNLEFTKRYEPHNESAQNFLKVLEGYNCDEHFFINTMKIEREINTFLRLKSPDLLKTLNLKSSDEKQVFLTLRELRNIW